jgi:hypothetical protein
MNKKYQVFISSTYEDLKVEREQAIKAVLEMGHIPVGMEMFSAGDEDQWKLIARQIEASDYYVLILGHRYGSETEDGISYTEKEYDYASEIGIPTLGFIIDDEAAWPASRVEKTQKKIKKITSFKSKVKSKLVHFWVNKDDLHGKISISLIKTMNGNPRTGWVRSDEAVGPDITKELTRLSAENSELRGKVRKLQHRQTEGVDEAREVVNIMNENSREFGILKNGQVEWKEAERHEQTLLEVFMLIAPEMIDEQSSSKIATTLAFELVGANYHNTRPIGTNRITGMITDFVALEVIETSKKKHSVNDENTYWSLTKLGKQVLKRARRIQLEEGIKTSEEKQSNDNEDKS